MTSPKLMADGSGGLPALEEVCPECGGEGRIATRRVGKAIVQGGKCSSCRGAGAVVTDDGLRLLGFLRRNAMAS